MSVAWFLGVFCSYFQHFSWLLSRPYDARDADDAGSWGAAEDLRGAVNPNKMLTLWAMFVVQ